MATIYHSAHESTVRSVVFKTREYYQGKPLYFVSLSGLADLGTRAVGKGSNWEKHLLRIRVNIPHKRMELPPGPTDGDYYVPSFRAKHWTVYAGLNGISNKKRSDYPGYAVNGFRLRDAKNLRLTALIEADLAVRDSDGYVEGVGFQLEILLIFTGYRKIVIT